MQEGNKDAPSFLLSPLLEDEHPVGGHECLKAAVAGGNIGAEIAEALAAVCGGIAVENFAPEAVGEAGEIGLDDVAVEEGLVAETGDDQKLIGAGNAGKGDQAVGPDHMDDVDRPTRVAGWLRLKRMTSW